MKKLAILSIAIIFFVLDSKAQIINGSTAAVVQHSRPKAVENIVKVKKDKGNTPSAEQESQKKQDTKVLSREEIEAMIKAERPLVAITPEQKAQIELEAKKRMRASIKKQSVRERKDFIDIMRSAEQIRIRRQALAEGKSIENIEDSVKETSINPANDEEMEKYLFEKARLVEVGKDSDAK